MSIRKHLARIKRRLMKKPYLEDKRYPGYWFSFVYAGKEANIVQIGSNDGKTGDPLYQLIQNNEAWKALFVEPIPHYFNSLKKHHGTSSRFRFENVAITDGEQMDLYWVSPEALKQHPEFPFWVGQLGTFDREHIVNELDGKLEPYIVSAKVECITLSQLLTRNQIETINILHIDAEGHDWTILKQLDLSKYNPNFILFEYVHLTEPSLQDAYQSLSCHYKIFDVGIDLLCVLEFGNNALIQQMDKHMPVFQT
jgi:FkbM family methyltransferase